MIPFIKYTGAGNDFVVIEAPALGSRDPAVVARTVCPRATGVGVDGLILVDADGEGRVETRFFNPDGSEFGTCGNGSRCVARWADDEGRALDGAVRLLTPGGAVDARVEGERVVLDYEIRAWIEGVRRVPMGGDEREGWLVQLGTPHFVVHLPELPDGQIETLCRPIRHHPDLGPDGANVDLVDLQAPSAGRVRTFERGVEAETQACGSGAMAATLALHAADRSAPELALLTRSGETLSVAIASPEDAPPAGEPAVREIRLAGPARRLFEGRFAREG